MGTIDLNDPVNGTVADAALIANNNAAIEAAVNGGIDAANFASGKILAPSKLTQEAATSANLLAWDQASATWKPALTAYARVYSNVDQNMAGNNNEDIVNFTHERVDTANIWAASPNPGRLVAPSTGLYVVGANLQFTNPANGWTVNVALRLSAGSFIFARQTERLESITPNPWVSVTGFVAMAANDYVQVVVNHSHSSAAVLRKSEAAEDRCSAWIYRLPGSAGA